MTDLTVHHDLARLGVDVRQGVDGTGYILPPLPGEPRALGRAIGSGLLTVVAGLVTAALWVFGDPMLGGMLAAGVAGVATWTGREAWLAWRWGQGQQQELWVGDDGLRCVQRYGLLRSTRRLRWPLIDALVMVDGAMSGQAQLVAESSAEPPCVLVAGQDVALTEAVAEVVLEAINAGRARVAPLELRRVSAEAWHRRLLLRPPEPAIEVREQADGVSITLPPLRQREMRGAAMLIVSLSVLMLLLLSMAVMIPTPGIMFFVGLMGLLVLTMVVAVVGRLGAVDAVMIEGDACLVLRQPRRGWIPALSHAVELDRIRWMRVKSAHFVGHRLVISLAGLGRIACLAGRSESVLQWVMAVIEHYRAGGAAAAVEADVTERLAT